MVQSLESRAGNRWRSNNTGTNLTALLSSTVACRGRSV
jgi:hypothetical protein